MEEVERRNQEVALRTTLMLYCDPRCGGWKKNSICHWEGYRGSCVLHRVSVKDVETKKRD